MKEKGKNSPIWKKISSLCFDEEFVIQQMSSLSLKDKTISEQQKKIKQDGDSGQGERLVGTKFKGNTSNK